jgi:DNA-binding response OmpR family regulator
MKAVMPLPESVEEAGLHRVLVADNEPLVRNFVGDVLRMHGYAVLEAENGTEAIRILREVEAPIHLLLTDALIPKVTGPALFARMLAFRPELRVLFMSVFPNVEPIVTGCPVPFEAFLKKPFSPDALVLKVRELLGDSR